MFASWLLLAALQATTPLPTGYNDMKWGMTPRQLKKFTAVVPADPKKGHAFAEHMEINPEVYISPAKDGRRLEYYFHKGKLYKVFIIYDRALNSDSAYDEKLSQLREQFGEPARTYSQAYFGFEVKHTQWEDAASVLDLRRGAGFLYEVRLSKALAADKQRLKERGDSI